MSNYTYPNSTMTFGARDILAPNNQDKRVSGGVLDLEFQALAASSATKLNTNNPAPTGIMSSACVLDGGTF